MKDIKYNVIENAPKDTHFAAVNSGRGFICYFSDAFGNKNITRRYIIKGGPGTGKSSFMKRVAAYAEEKGRAVEYFRCSSDPASLDGIIVDGRIAVFDGTAPHTYDPVLAGVEDEIVNLGDFWNADALYAYKEEVSLLSAKRSAVYAKVYRFLSAAMNVAEINGALALGALKRDKMKGAVSRLLRQIPDGEKFSIEYGHVNAIGMGGLAHLPSFEKKAKRLYTVYDSYGLGAHFLSELIEGAADKKLRIQVSYSPLLPDRPDAVYLPDCGIAFVISDGKEDDGAHRINMSRFTDDRALEGIRAEYRRNKKTYEALLSAAVDALAEAGKYHFKLEDIYKSCMDFEAESRFCDEFCKKHF